MTPQDIAKDKEAVAKFRCCVDVRGPDDCWPWTGRSAVKGRGLFFFKGGRVLAPRLAWARAPGERCGACYAMRGQLAF